MGCQVIASRFRFPAIILLLPVGFVDGILTSSIYPNPRKHSRGDPSTARAASYADPRFGPSVGVTRFQMRLCTTSMIMPTTIRIDTLSTSWSNEPQASCHDA
jgi:hypothetical protein